MMRSLALLPFHFRWYVIVLLGYLMGVQVRLDEYLQNLSYRKYHNR